MNGREGLARAAAGFIPSKERPELVHTALDVSGGSPLLFVRELFGLVWYGYRRRGKDLTGTRTDRVLADGVAQGAIWVVILELADLLSHIRAEHRFGRLPGAPSLPPPPIDSRPAAVLLAVALVLALVGLDRAAGMAGLAWLAVWTPILADYRTAAGLCALLVPLLGFLVLLVAPRRRPLDARRLIWLAVPAALVFTTGPGGDSTGFLIWLPVVLAVTAAAVVLLPSDPRLAIAATFPVLYIGAQSARHGEPGAYVVGSTFFVVLALALAFRRLRQPRRAVGGGRP